MENLQNMFTNFPVITHETHRVKMGKIAEFDIEMAPPPEGEEDKEKKAHPRELFIALMSSINPFAKFVIQEISEEYELNKGAS